MTAVLLLGPVLSLLVLAAHFLRAGRPALVALTIAITLLLLARRPWAARSIQAALVLGVVEWTRTLLLLRAARVAAGEPAARMTLILGAVAAVALLSSLAFEAPRLRRAYGRAPRMPLPPTP